MNPELYVRLGAVAADPGFYVTSEELRDYADTVDKLVRDIDRAVLAAKGSMGPTATGYWPLWVNYLVEWTGVHQKTRTTWVRGAAYLAVRDFHARALAWRDKWEKAGVPMREVDVTVTPSVSPGGPPVETQRAGKPISAPLPPPSGEDEGSEAGRRSGGASISAGWYVAAGFALVGVGVVLAKRAL